MLAKSKIISILLTIIFCVSAITCGIVFGVSKSQPQSTATTESVTTGLETNIFNTNGTINATAAKALLDAVGYFDYSATTTRYTAHNIAGRTSNNSGKSIIFKMGYASGTSGTNLVWQATYLYNNYLTIWLDKNYNTNTWDSDYGVVNYNTYPNSDPQVYFDGTLYNLITQRSSTLKSIFATPRQAGYQTIKSGTTNDTSYWYNSSYTSKFDNMAEGVADSYLWLPSFGEVFNNTTSSYSDSTTAYTGQWGLNSTDRAFDSSTSYSGSSTSEYCWLRSGNSDPYDRAMIVFGSGASGGNRVFGAAGVRPAAHLSLSSIDSFVSKTVTFNSNGGSSCASIKVSPNTAYGTLPTPTKTGYTFVGWYKSSDLSGSAVSASDIVTADHTLYAKWTPKTYTVTLDKQSGSGGTSSVTATYTQAMPTATAPTRTGYTFGGYYTGTNGSGTQYYTSTMASAKNWDIASNTTLYAKWIINSYTITIQITEGGVVSSAGGTYNYDTTITSFAAPNVGKAFLYWVRASDNAHFLENPLNQSVTGNETYTAVFGASVEGVNVASTYGGKATVVGDNYDSLSDDDYIIFSTCPAVSGYAFSHWEDMNGNNLGTEMSIRLQKSLVMDNIITAVYVQSSANIDDTLNNV
ncbi:MAG: InlB B-repeat-containing protein [Clostridia bacterium]|nr:InlB B-repeat-containing protein [Clostridia bacterium]